MTIYQCDMCHKHFQSKSDLLRLTIKSDKYSDAQGYYEPTDLYVVSELCENCTTTVANTLVDMISNGGVTIE